MTLPFRLPYTIGMVVFGLIGSVVVQKTGRFKWALITGSAIAAVGGGILYTVGTHTSYPKIAGFQVGFFFRISYGTLTDLTHRSLLQLAPDW